MVKVRLTTNSNEAGFSVVEVLLAVTVFGLLVASLMGALVYGRGGVATAGDRQRAVLLAEEGLEAVRNIGNEEYALLVDGTYGLAQANGVWNLSGTSDTNGVYTRQITITSVGIGRKTIAATVSWPQQGTTSNVTLTSRLNNWQSAFPRPGPIMMAYSKTAATPYYRIWNGAAWGAEAPAKNVTGDINYVALKSARNRNEAILVTQTSTGAIFAQVWNGTKWTTPTQLGTASTTMKSFDIAYEKNSDRAIVVYAAGPDFSYRIWDGGSFSPASTVIAPPTTGNVNWMQLSSNPLASSNEVAMIMLDSNSDVYGMTWNGNSWNSMGSAAAWDDSASTANKMAIGVEYEQNSGEAMFIWGDSVATDQYYRTWNGTTLSAAALLDIPAQGGVAEWVQLAARPNSDEIMFGAQDSGANLNTRKWSGTTWDTAIQHAEHSAAVENTTSRVFDIVWETHSSNSGKAWLVWSTPTNVSTKPWLLGTSWGVATNLTGSDDTSYIKLRADATSGAVFMGLYEDSTSDTDDIWESRLIGGGSLWSAKNTIWDGPTGATPVYFRIDISTP